MADRVELKMDDLDMVTGGSYVTTSMTIGEIIETDHKLMSFMAKAGIPVSGNKSLRGRSLQEVADSFGVDPYSLENKMNEYLSSK